MGILVTIKSQSIPMTKAKSLSLVPMELMPIVGCLLFQRCIMSIFSDMIEKIMEVFMDDFSIYGKTFDDCLENLDKVL
jgi:hypothetical protein